MRRLLHALLFVAGISVAASNSYSEIVIAERIELSDSEKVAIVEAASHVLGRSAVGIELYAYRVKPERPKAWVTFEPYNITSTTFDVDQIICEKGRFSGWSCDEAKSQSFFYDGKLSRSVRLFDDVDGRTASSLIAHATASGHCKISLEPSSQLFSLRSRPYIRRAEGPNEYIVLHNCGQRFVIRNGEVISKGSFNILE